MSVIFLVLALAYVLSIPITSLEISLSSWLFFPVLPYVIVILCPVLHCPLSMGLCCVTCSHGQHVCIAVC